MRENGLLPDFSPAVKAEANALTQAATDAAARDVAPNVAQRAHPYPITTGGGFRERLQSAAS